MKKRLAFLMALLMALSLCGCTQDLAQFNLPPLPEVTPTPAPVFPDAPAVESSAEGETQPVEDAQPDAQTPETSGEIQGNQGGFQVIIPDASGTQNPDSQPAETENPDSQPVETENPVEEIREEESAVSMAVSIRHVEMKANDPQENQKQILTFSYDETRMSAPDNPSAAEKINELLATIEDAFYTGNSNGLSISFLGYDMMLEVAEDNYGLMVENGTEDDMMELSDSLSAQVTRLDEGVFSILYADSSYTGCAHGTYWGFGCSFDMSTGDILTLDQLSEDPTAFQDFLTEKMLELVREDKDHYYSDHIDEAFLPEGGLEAALRNLLRDGGWYFTRDGLVITSTLYELGPYAVGITEFCIPYEDLEDRLKPAYLFPTERKGEGTVQVAKLDWQESGELSYKYRVEADEDGQILDLVIQGRIYDVQISRVYYAGDSFYELSQVWTASMLEDCDVYLKALVPEGLPNLRVSYTTGDGQRHGKVLTVSGVNGQVLLRDDDISVVG